MTTPVPGAALDKEEVPQRAPALTPARELPTARSPCVPGAGAPRQSVSRARGAGRAPPTRHLRLWPSPPHRARPGTRGVPESLLNQSERAHVSGCARPPRGGTGHEPPGSAGLVPGDVQDGTRRASPSLGGGGAGTVPPPASCRAGKPRPPGSLTPAPRGETRPSGSPGAAGREPDKAPRAGATRRRRPRAPDPGPARPYPPPGRQAARAQLPRDAGSWRPPGPRPRRQLSS